MEINTSKNKKNTILLVIVSCLVLVVAVTILVIVLGTSPREYNVTFKDSLGGIVEEQVVKENGLAERPHDIILEGYTFDDWFTDETFSRVWQFDTFTITRDTTIIGRLIKTSYLLNTEINDSSLGSVLFSRNSDSDFSLNNTSANKNDTIYCKIEANSTYQIDTIEFIGVSVDVSDFDIESNIYPFTMPSNNIVVKVNFSLKEYTNSISKVGEGTVDVVPTSLANSLITITATPASGYELSKIVVNGVTISGNTFTMPKKNTIIVVTFSPKTIQITLDYSQYSSTIPSSVIYVKYLEQFSDLPTNVPAIEPYQFGGFYTLDNTLISNSSTNNFTENTTIYAHRTTPTQARLFGNGSETNPYKIYNTLQLMDISSQVSYYNYILVSDLEIDDSFVSVNLFGVLDCNNKNIKISGTKPIFDNLKSASTYVSSVKNLVVDISENGSISVMVANTIQNGSSIYNIKTTTCEILNNSDRFYGFVKTNYGIIENCKNYSSITFSSTAIETISVFANENFGEISNVFNLAEYISCQNTCIICGVCVNNYGTITTYENRTNFIDTDNSYSICKLVETNGNSTKTLKIEYCSNYGDSTTLVKENPENITLVECNDYANP